MMLDHLPENATSCVYDDVLRAWVPQEGGDRYGAFVQFGEREHPCSIHVAGKGRPLPGVFCRVRDMESVLRDGLGLRWLSIPTELPIGGMR